jgi:hypothetical protein
MELEPIIKIKKDTPLQLILVYELGEDQVIDIPIGTIFDSDFLHNTITYNLIKKRNRHDIVIKLRTLDTLMYVYFHQVINGVQYETKNLYLNDVL